MYLVNQVNIYFVCVPVCVHALFSVKAPVRREATTTYDLRLPTTGSDRGQSQ